MGDFQTSLLREKFVIRNISLPSHDDRHAVIALSNRMQLALGFGSQKEILVVRAQNMHLTVRMAARILQSFNQRGPLTSRAPAFDWQGVWNSIVNDYEYAFNPQRWVVVYKDGKPIFNAGERHPFLDLLEKCSHEHKQRDYDFSPGCAEDMLRDAGQNVKITHNSNVALNVEFKNDEGRCGIILRGPDKTTTFTILITKKSDGPAMNIPQALGACAGFLEGVQLAAGLVETTTSDYRVAINADGVMPPLPGGVDIKGVAGGTGGGAYVGAPNQGNGSGGLVNRKKRYASVVAKGEQVQISRGGKR